jgi:hypothetical protein
MPIIRKYNGVDLSPPGTGSTNSYTTLNITGTVAETILSTTLIPANTFQQYDIIGIESRLRKGSTSATATIKIRIGTTQSLTATQVATYTSTSASHGYIPIMRRMVVKTVDGSGSGTEVLTTGTSMPSDVSRAGDTGISNLAINWTVDNYIIATGQLGNTGDTMNCMYLITDYITGV